MSAIFGFYRRDGRSANPDELDRMCESLEHRGPDGSGAWCEGEVGLGQLALHTTPESAFESWPIRNGEKLLVADARIDNRDELIAILGLRGRSSVITDGEIILSAYLKWGRSAPEKLIGDFAFAVWDPARRVFFCARDPMGVKPLYYHASDGLFAYASEIKALFCLPEISRELDEVQIAYFLDFFLGDPERTFYRNVLRLPTSSWLEVGPDGVRSGKYWVADPTREVRLGSDEEYAEAFRDLFTEAVRCRLRSDFPVGTALSGGLDSSSITCVARDLLEKTRPLHVFSGVFPGLPEADRQRNDESRFIDAVTASEGIVSHRVQADKLSVFDYLEGMYRYHDAPPFAFLHYMRWAVYEAAHEQGIRVFLSGDDGDSVVSHGYERFFDLAREGMWNTATDEIKALGRRMNVSPGPLFEYYVRPHFTILLKSGHWRSWMEATRDTSRSFGRSRVRLMARSAAEAFVPDRMVEFSRRLRGIKATPSFLRADFVERTDLESRKRSFRPDNADPIPSGRVSHALSLPSALLQYVMELTDSTASAFSMETRCPFLDRRLVEFCLSVPSEQKLADGWTRVILRRAMEGILPPEIQWRVRKGDLAYSFVRSLREGDRHALAGALFEDPEVLEDYVDMDGLRSLHERFDSGGTKGARVASGQLYIAAVLARWLRESRSEAPQLPVGLAV